MLAIRDSVNLFGLKSFVLEPRAKTQKPNVLVERCRVDFGRTPEEWIGSRAEDPEESRRYQKTKVQNLRDATPIPIFFPPPESNFL